ncbi:MAG: hypothetical protein HND51_11985 [Chloroflexi bacterium]|nr:hypothetical protein [Chloroflexota bacterium]
MNASNQYPPFHLQLVLALLLFVASCGPQNNSESPSSDANPTGTSTLGPAQENTNENTPLAITLAEVEWQNASTSTCTGIPQATLNLCISNPGSENMELSSLHFVIPIFSSLRNNSGLSEKGIIIVDGMPGVGALSELAEKGIIIVDGRPSVDALSELAERGIIIVDGMPSDEVMSDLVAKGIIIVDGRPANSDVSNKGIIIVDGLPSDEVVSDLAAKGIIIVDGMPGVDALSDLAEKGIIIVDGMPSDEVISDLVANGIIIVDGRPANSDVSNKGIIIVDGMPGVEALSDLAEKGIIIVDGMPSGFEFGQGMMSMLGDAGFGGGSFLFGALNLSSFGFPASLNPGFEACQMVDLGVIAQLVSINSDPQFETEMRSMNLKGASSLRISLPGVDGDDVSSIPVFAGVSSPPIVCTSTPTPTATLPPTSTATLAPLWTLTPTPTEKPERDDGGGGDSGGSGGTCLNALGLPVPCP